eukprot:11190209-Lingulodinium_polyedra.AAC.1
MRYTNRGPGAARTRNTWLSRASRGEYGAGRLDNVDGDGGAVPRNGPGRVRMYIASNLNVCRTPRAT